MDRATASKNQIKYLQSLKLKKNRQKYTAFIAQGRKVVEEILIDNILEVKGLYAVKDWFGANPELTDMLKAPQYEVTDRQIKQISSLHTADQVVIECGIPDVLWPEQVENRWILYLDSISDPGNLGAIIRSADWFGVAAVFLSPGSVDLFNPKTVQATMGSIGRVWAGVNTLTIVQCRYTDHQIYVAAMEGHNVRKIKSTPPGILVIGNESHGPSEDSLQIDHIKVHIPKAPGRKIDSLNAAMATTALLALLSD